MTTDNGEPGWIVFQRRLDGSVDFNRNWNTYKNGFGDLDGEFWLGNDNVAKNIASGNFQMRIELGDWEGEHRYAQYSFVRVLGESDKYQLIVGDYSVGAGDALSCRRLNSQNGSYFSAIDQDNDQHSASHCANYLKAGFWYNNCGSAYLNNPYHVGGVVELSRGIMWSTDWHDPLYSFKSTVMKVRPIFD